VTKAITATKRKRQARAAYSVIALVAIIYTVLALLRLIRFDLTAFDAGIFDNVLWRLGNGYNDVTAITGFHHLSDHMSLLLLLAVPVYAVAPGLGLPLLIVAQAISVALVGVATWLLADHLELDDERRRAALLMALMGAGAYNAALIDIHEVGLALGPLAMTAVLAIRNHPMRRYWIWPVLAAVARIDLAVSVLIIGLLVRRQHPSHGRIAITVGTTAAGAMGLWLLLNPWEGTSFSFHFAHLGIDSAAELPGAAVSDPAAALEPLLDPTMWGTISIWFAGFMLLPLRAARWLLPALPTVVIPILGSWQQADEPHLHYWHVLLPMMAIAAVYGLARSPELKNRAFYLAVAAVAATWAFMPLFKPSLSNDISDEQATVAYLRGRPIASVAAFRTLVPHITTRPVVMQLPTPFACPTTPIASFVGPDAPPELVAFPGSVLDRPVTAADEAVVKALENWYQPAAVFGRIEVWELTGQVPVVAYSIACGADPSANS
jgi:uncharacterized membrane protein